MPNALVIRRVMTSVALLVMTNLAIAVDLNDVQTRIFTPNCAKSGCHNGTQHPNLSAGQAFNNIVNKPAAGFPSLDYIEPGDPDNSYLVRKIEGTGQLAQMPLDNVPLSSADMQLVRDWVAQGALKTEADDSETPAAEAAQVVVTIETVLGSFDVLMLDVDAPATVANFLNYVRRGDYDGTFIHRIRPGFIVQGGGFVFDQASQTAPAINADPPVVNEFKVSNTRGTVAMAKLGNDPNSATNQWFVNLADNSVNLDNQNGGFTVFGRVLGNGMEVVDTIAGQPRWNLSSAIGGTFTDTPMINFNGNLPFITGNFVTVNRASTGLDTDNDGINDDSDTDDDDDGVLDIDDAFPLDASETLDTDGDNIGNNADTDDDNDGVSDVLELSFGLDPLDPNDVTGSPREIFWRHALSGENVLWSMESQHRVERNAIISVADAQWRVEGMADFDNDGMDEIFFRHQASGENRLWGIENGVRTSSDAIRAAHPDWFVIAMGDFDADGDADLMWRNRVNGANRYWQMQGTTRVSSLAVRTVSLSWSVAGSGDFDGDGRNDLLWRNTNGANVVWLMQGQTRLSRGSLPTVGGDWEVAGIGDFDGDNMDDMLWHNPTTGANSMWLLDGAARKSRVSLPGTPIGWHPFAVFDMNGDGMADILWRNSSDGANRLWLMNGSGRGSSLAVRPISDQNWQPVAVGNVNN